MPVQIIREPISLDDVVTMAHDQFGDMVKAVVDVARGIMALGAELHADEEAILLEDGSRQPDLWGINLYPETTGEAWIEFDSMINVRPSLGNRSRAVEAPALQLRIRAVVADLVRR